MRGQYMRGLGQLHNPSQTRNISIHFVYTALTLARFESGC